MGFEAAGAQKRPWQEGDWQGEALVLEEVPALQQEGAQPPQQASAAPGPESRPALPSWMGHAPLWRPVLPVAEKTLARPLSPSRPDDAMLGPLPPVRSPLDVASITPAAAREAAFRRGNLIHALLQYLPAHPPEQWAERAQGWRARPASGLKPAEAQNLAHQVLGVLALPDLAPLFAPEARAEQKLAGLAGGQVIVGQVDRMRVLPDRVLVCDFKSGRHMPRNVAGTPVLYLRQMAAYRALLQGLYPTKPIVCVLVWTEGPRADVLPDTMLEVHAPGGATS